MRIASWTERLMECLLVLHRLLYAVLQDTKPAQAMLQTDTDNLTGLMQNRADVAEAATTFWMTQDHLVRAHQRPVAVRPSPAPITLRQLAFSLLSCG